MVYPTLVELQLTVYTITLSSKNNLQNSLFIAHESNNLKRIWWGRKL